MSSSLNKISNPIINFPCTTSKLFQNVREKESLAYTANSNYVRYKSNIFAKIIAKGKSGYFVLGAISKIIAGYLFTINGYLPFICSLIVLIIVTIISTFYIEPIKKKNKQYHVYTIYYIS